MNENKKEKRIKKNGFNIPSWIALSVANHIRDWSIDNFPRDSLLSKGKIFDGFRIVDE